MLKRKSENGKLKSESNLHCARLIAALTFQLSDFTFHLSPHFVRFHFPRRSIKVGELSRSD